MANLLPSRQLQTVQRERRMRVAVLVLVFLAVTLLLGSIFLIPSVWLSYSKRASMALQVETVAQLIEQKERDEVTHTLRRTREMLTLLGGVEHHPHATAYLDRIAAHAGSAIDIHRISYAVQPPESAVSEEASGESSPERALVAEIGLDGMASDREALLSFVRRIERDEAFSGVELPVSNLAERTNIPFTVTIAVIDSSHE